MSVLKYGPRLNAVHLRMFIVWVDGLVGCGQLPCLALFGWVIGDGVKRRLVLVLRAKATSSVTN